MSTDTQQDAREQARHKASATPQEQVKANTLYIIETTQAYFDGKQIQETPFGLDEWYDTRCPKWNWDSCNYRVKPEERKPREVKLWVSDNLADVFTENTLIHHSVGLVWRLATFREVLPETETE